jgi:cytochrome P450
VRASASALLDEAIESGRLDAATQYAQRIPTLTMCELMDLPSSDRAQFLKWNLDTLAGSDFTSDAALRAYAEMGDYWERLVGERRKRRGSDLISQILHAEVEGAALSDAEIGGFCSLLHDASQNTTMNMIGHTILTLGRHADARRALAADAALWPRALDELLRFISPVQGLARSTTREIELHGVRIGADEQVLLLYGAANHDERAWPNPEGLDLARDARAHVAFGRGIHTCLGASVARLEIRVALQVLIERLRDWEVDEAGIVHNQLVPTRGLAKAPVSFCRKGSA